MNPVSIPLMVKSRLLESVQSHVTTRIPANTGDPGQRRTVTKSKVEAATNARQIMIRKIHSAATSDVLKVSKLAAAGSNTPNGDVKVCKRSPTLKTKPLPVAKCLLARYVM